MPDPRPLAAEVVDSVWSSLPIEPEHAVEAAALREECIDELTERLQECIDVYRGELEEAKRGAIDELTERLQECIDVYRGELEEAKRGAETEECEEVA